MFERFTEGARTVVADAHNAARELQQWPIGTEHLLLATVAADSPAATVLHGYGIDEMTVRDGIVRHSATPSAAVSGPEQDAQDAEALRSIGIDLEAVRRAIEENFGAGALRLPHSEPPPKRGLLRGRARPPVIRGHIPLSPRAKKTLGLSLREAVGLHHNFIAPEHLVLGILREGGGLATLILTDAGVDFDRLRADLTRSVEDAAA